MTELARLLDPAELDAATGPHGRLTIELPSARARGGEPVEIHVPTRLVCGRCEGGGCDACGRSGAVMIDLPEAERTTRVVLPADAGERLLVRLVRPLGDEAGLEQLTLDVRLTADPAAESEALATLGSTAMTVGSNGPQPLRSIIVAAALALAAALAIAASLR